MGKVKKSRKKYMLPVERNLPLGEQIAEAIEAKQKLFPKRRAKEENFDEFVDSKLSKKILKVAKEQQLELEEEHGLDPKTARITKLKSSKPEAEDSDESDTEIPAEFESDEIVLDGEDEKALETFMNKDGVVSKSLAEVVKEKLTDKKTELTTQFSDDSGLMVNANLDERVINMYSHIGEILSQYRSGVLPKAFKVIPMLRNWEQILYLTEPEGWSSAAVYQATRIFSSNLNAKMAQRFYNLVLLPRVRDDIDDYKKLNCYLYMALQKALYKPAGFFKGIIIPLCEVGNCTLREATIIASVLTKTSIPMLHSAATVLKIAEMDYNGANSIFLRTLLDKKYALPYRVIDAVVFHFLQFLNDKRELPVLWHQAFLTFVQRYKEDISSEQKESLLEVLKKHKHAKMTPEIRRELVNSKCRDEEDAVPPDHLME